MVQAGGRIYSAIPIQHRQDFLMRPSVFHWSAISGSALNASSMLRIRAAFLRPDRRISALGYSGIPAFKRINEHAFCNGKNRGLFIFPLKAFSRFLEFFRDIKNNYPPKTVPFRWNIYLHFFNVIS